MLLVQDSLAHACAQICSAEVAAHCPVARPASAGSRQRWLERYVWLARPRVGVKVGRAEFLKARSCSDVVRLAGGRAMVMERKYDGEYCQVALPTGTPNRHKSAAAKSEQIHIDLGRADRWITIFSKSGRESTADRAGLHVPLRRALAVDEPGRRGFGASCIVEGEMLVYSDGEQRVLPFDHIRRHVARAGVPVGSRNDPRPAADCHLMVVLFDVLLLDGRSLLAEPLAARRRHLQQLVVRPRRGRCQLAERVRLDFALPGTHDRLQRYFARAIRDRWEGVVLKPCLAPYFNLLHRRPDSTSRGHGFWTPGAGAGAGGGAAGGVGGNLNIDGAGDSNIGSGGGGGGSAAWIKLKKDYIAGLGDAADFAVVGGVADRTRAHALTAAAGLLNTFHVAVLLNKADVARLGAKPRLQVLFAVAYSIGRPDLEWIQRTARRDAVLYHVAAPSLSVRICVPS